MNTQNPQTPEVQPEEVVTQEIQSFTEFGLRPEILKSIADKGFDVPSPIQKKAIPFVLEGRDIIGQAQTGSGKTAAFAIPAIQRLAFDKTVEVLVLVPTRELCKQVVAEFESLGRNLNLRVVSVVGGESAFRQIELINRGAQVVVATPGRILDHLRNNKLKNFKPKMVILDEADEMLDMGFIDDIKSIMEQTPATRQTLLFSATMAPGVNRLAKDLLNNPEQIRLADANVKHESIEQRFYLVKNMERESALIRLLQAERPEKAIIFCRTKNDTMDLTQQLAKANIRAICLHGDLSQNERNRVTNEIRKGYATILVATDVASRGLDIDDLSHVINYHVPESNDRYTHRIGRTGRAGQKGAALTLATPEEINGIFFMKKKLREKSITLADIPAKNVVQDLAEKEFIETVSDTEIIDAAKKLYREFDNDDEAIEFLMKLYSFARKKALINGPDQIGYKSSQWLSIESSEKKNFRRKRGFSSSGGQGGRDRSRPQQGRYSSGGRSSRSEGRGPSRGGRSSASGQGQGQQQRSR